MIKTQAESGFTLIELITVVSVLAVVLILTMPTFIRHKMQEREDEVKANIHTIQIQLERYAVDSGGIYPYMLYGGDETDTFVKSGSPDYLPQDDPDYTPYSGDFDVLIQYAYLDAYPSNPFQADRDVATDGKIKTNPGENGFGHLEIRLNNVGRTRTNIWARPSDRGTEYVRRDVGGADGRLMWDVSEGQRHPPWLVVLSPEPQPHFTGFTNLAYSDYDREHAENIGSAQQFWLTPGNFYYYGIFEGTASYTGFYPFSSTLSPLTGWVIGYHLCGYGEIENLGDDVYNRYGDFREGSLVTVGRGADGRPDGVIISVESGTGIDEEAWTFPESW